jgi:hypothetical protein
MRINILVLIAGLINAATTSASTNPTSIFDLADQNCQPNKAQPTPISSSCKTFMTENMNLFSSSSLGNMTASEQQKFDLATKSMCSVCALDFENIVPLPMNFTNESNVLCGMISIVYNILPIVCKQNDKGVYCLNSISRFQLGGEDSMPSSPQEFCSKVDCCSLEMMNAIMPANESAIVLNQITTACNISADLQTCKKQSYTIAPTTTTTTTTTSNDSDQSSSSLTSSEIGLAAGGAVIGISAAAAGILFYVKKRRNPAKNPKEIGLTSTA